MDGYNVTIFAYGQTGAGKTHTMSGSKEEPGLVWKFSKEIFDIVQRDKDRYNVEVSVSMLELYLQDLNDLLVSINEKQSLSSADAFLKRKKPINVALRNGMVEVDGAVEKTVDSTEGLQKIITDGFDVRTVQKYKSAQTIS